MGESTDYSVTTHFKAVDKMSAGLAKMGARVTAFGKAVRGTTIQSAKMFATIGAGAAGAAGAVGFGAMVVKGLSFNKVMEDSQAQIATIFQMFNQNAAASGEVNDISKQWASNLGLAKDSMNELYGIAKKSPASFAQVTTLFQNASAGLATTTSDVGRQMDFMKKAVLAGGLVGGDYKTLGSQVGRILAGSAGAEMDIWKIMQKPVVQAGKNLGIFGKSMEANAKLTEQFNQLTGEQRLSIMEEALGNLSGPVADYFGQTMGGIMSTTTSAIDEVSGTMTSKLYDGFKNFLRRANAAGGIFGPENLEKLKQAAAYVGDRLANGAEIAYDWIERSVTYFANNWYDIVARMEAMWEGAKVVAKMFLAASAVRAAAGTGIMAAGAVTSGVGAAVSGLKMVVQVVQKLGVWSIALAAGLGLIAVVVAGLAPVMMGVGAYLVETWDSIWSSIKKGFATGRTSIEPLIAAVDLLWSKLYAVGQVLLGGTDWAGVMQDAILATVSGIDFFIDALSGVLSASASVTYGIGFFITALAAIAKALGSFMRVLPGFKTIGAGLEATADGMLNAGERVAEFSGAMEQMAIAFDTAESGADSLGAKVRSVFADIEKRRMLDKGKQLAEKSGRWLTKTAKGLDKTTGGLFGALLGRESKKAEAKPPVKPTGNVNIGTLNVNQDLRDTDPDRLLVAFIDPLKEMADKPKTSYFNTRQGY